ANDSGSMKVRISARAMSQKDPVCPLKKRRCRPSKESGACGLNVTALIPCVVRDQENHLNCCVSTTRPVAASNTTTRVESNVANCLPSAVQAGERGKPLSGGARPSRATTPAGSGLPEEAERAPRGGRPRLPARGETP